MWRCGILQDCCSDNHSKTHITLSIFVLESYSRVVCNLLLNCEYVTLAWPRFVCSVLRDGSDVSVQCVCAVRCVAGWAQDPRHTPVRSAQPQVAGCAAGTRQLIRCLGDVKCQTTLLPSGLSPTIPLLLVIADKLLIEVSELAVPS